MATIHEIPEIAAWRSARGIVRIPPGLDVPLTARVRRLIDTPAFRRLAHVSQLGLVSLVYPAANHTRQEHSLGVYRVAIEYLARLVHDSRFVETVTSRGAERFLVAALLHDIGHWPFCHAIEDIRLPGVPQHEELSEAIFADAEIAGLLREDWNFGSRDIVALLSDEPAGDRELRTLRSMLSGPIDIDKVDYLMRDSLHAGVPYGRHFDQHRLINSLCLNGAGDGLAITEKGRTAAEMMVFARYVMFSEVYWHHAVRSATAMLQRAFYLLREQLDLDILFRMTEQPLIGAMRSAAGQGAAGELLDGLFGPRRQLYKRLAQFSIFEDPEIYQQLARQPYPKLAECAERFAAVLGKKTGQAVAPHEVLFDAPPVELEVEFNVDVYFVKHGIYRRLGDVSPVVRTLAKDQFDDYVKRVRIFIHPRLREAMKSRSDLSQLVIEAIDGVD